MRSGDPPHRRIANARAWALSAIVACAACGGRSQIPGGAAANAGAGGQGSGGSAPVAACEVDGDCGASDACSARFCVAGACMLEHASCDDGDTCTEDGCDPLNGCVHRALVSDLDGDGHPGPLPGFLPDTPGACGDDCDDHDALAFPGNREACDGVDNDCNGVIDDGAVYRRTRAAPVRVSSSEFVRASSAGFTAAGNDFLLSYTGVRSTAGNGERSVAELCALDGSGNKRFDRATSQLNADTFAGVLTWSGDSVASAWNDARQSQSYEIYFARFDAAGDRLGPDARVTMAPGFSLSADLRWTGSEYALAWDDRRGERGGGGDHSQIFGQRIAADGSLIDGNVLLVGDDPITESPSLALGTRSVGLVYTTLSDTSRLGYRTFTRDLASNLGVNAPLGTDVQAPVVTFVSDRYIAAWSIQSGTWGDAIWAAAFDENGKLLVPAQPVTSGAEFARSQALLSLGDRVLMVWADDHDGNYELYTQTLSPDLRVLSPRQRLTSSDTPSLSPALAIGPSGAIGLVYEDSVDGSRQVYFTSLECDAGQP